ncbi:MAG: hypothetical protein QW767_01090 [Thermoprotei archaeon]
MQYCPKCGGVMVPRKEKNKMLLYCAKCGNVAPYKNVKAQKIEPAKKSVDVVVEEDAGPDDLDQESKEAFLEAYDIEDEDEPSDD